MVIDCICLFAWHVIETLVNVNQLKTGSSCTSLYWLVCDRYSTFPLLGVSSFWLLLAVSLTRDFPLLAITQRFLYLTYPMKSITCIFTQTFHYPTFQLLDVSALPLYFLVLRKTPQKLCCNFMLMVYGIVESA